MSDWDVYLIFVKGSSNKFWRARTQGSRLFVNYGRIGSDGQTQIKDLASDEQARQEMEKVAASKRKKGYWDHDAAAAGEEAAAPAPAPAAAPAPAPAADRPQVTDLELRAGGRKIELRLVQQGAALRTVVVEHYDSPQAAAEAFARISAAMTDEGYRKVAARQDL